MKKHALGLLLILVLLIPNMGCMSDEEMANLGTRTGKYVPYIEAQEITLSVGGAKVEVWRGFSTSHYISYGGIVSENYFTLNLQTNIPSWSEGVQPLSFETSIKQFDIHKVHFKTISITPTSATFEVIRNTDWR